MRKHSLLVVIGVLALPIAFASCESWKKPLTGSSNNAIEGDDEPDDPGDPGDPEPGDPEPEECGEGEDGSCSGECPEGESCQANDDGCGCVKPCGSNEDGSCSGDCADGETCKAGDDGCSCVRDCGAGEGGACTGACPENERCALIIDRNGSRCGCSDIPSCADTYPACDGACGVGENGETLTCQSYTGASDGCACLTPWPPPPPPPPPDDDDDFCEGKEAGCYPPPDSNGDNVHCWGIGSAADCTSPCVWCSGS